jgi:hypothetical protein
LKELFLGSSIDLKFENSEFGIHIQLEVLSLMSLKLSVPVHDSNVMKTIPNRPFEEHSLQAHQQGVRPSVRCSQTGCHWQ